MKKYLASCLLSLVSCVSFAADTYPSHPIKIIVPFGPGGFTDGVARILQK